MAHTTIKIGSIIVAFTVVADMNNESIILIIRKLQRTPLAVFPNLMTKLSASLLANLVFTSMLASTKLNMLSHITGCPNWASASFCVVTPNITVLRMTSNEVK